MTMACGGSRNAIVKNYVRDYAQEYATAKKRHENGTGHDSNNAKDHRLRRKMLKLGLVKRGQDVDHIRAQSKGGSPTPSPMPVPAHRTTIAAIRATTMAQ
jgi:hypothetical protein